MDRIKDRRAGYRLTLKRQDKRRYILVTCRMDLQKSIDGLFERVSELFGTISLGRAALKIMVVDESYAIIRCSLGSFENVLVAMTLCNPPILSLSSSGTLAGLKKEMAALKSDPEWTKYDE